MPPRPINPGLIANLETRNHHTTTTTADYLLTTNPKSSVLSCILFYHSHCSFFGAILSCFFLRFFAQFLHFAFITYLSRYFFFHMPSLGLFAIVSSSFIKHKTPSDIRRKVEDEHTYIHWSKRFYFGVGYFHSRPRGTT